MHTASRGGGDGGGGGGGGGGDDDDGARQARRCVWRCATGTHGYLLAETRPPCSRRRCWSICTGGKSSTWSLVIRQLAAVDAQRIDRQHARVAARVRLRRQHWPARLQAAAPARREVGEHRFRAEPDTSDLTHALGGRPDKVTPLHASVLRQSASQPPAPPKIGWQAPKWLSRLSHVHGSPFTAGHVVLGARHDAGGAARPRVPRNLVAEGRRSRRSNRRDSRLHSACNSARRRTSGARRSRRALRRRAGCALPSSAQDNSAA